MKRLLTGILMLLSVLLAEAQQIVHTVQRGETLESIAQKYHVTKEAIVSNNPYADDAFYVGLKLYIPESDTSEQNVITQQKPATNETNSPSLTSEAGAKMTYSTNNETSDYKKNTWHLTFRLGPSFYNSEKNGGMRKEYGYTSTYSQAWGYEVSIGAHYYFIENLYASAMLGYYQASSSFSLNQIGAHNSTSVVSHNVSMPIELGASLPITKNIGFIIEVGPTFLYAVDGYTKIDKEKISFSKMEDDYDADIDRFGAFLRLGGGLNLWGFRVQGYYGIPLSKFPGASEKKNFWGITIGWEM